MENNEIVKQKSNKGLIIVLVILLIGALGYIAYDKFIAKEETKTNEITETEKETNDISTKDTSSEETDVTDLITFVNDGTNMFYGYIEDGYLLYKYGKVSESYLPYQESDNDNYIKSNSDLKKYDKLNNVEKIIAFNDNNQAVIPKIYLITSDGKVYDFTMGLINANVEFTLNEKLKDYNVKEIVSVKPLDNITIKLSDESTISVKW